MRIIAGSLKNLSVNAPRGSKIRPTTGYIREMVFSIMGPDRLSGCLFLDLYAGTGVVGLEAMSRGARKVTFVDSDLFLISSLSRFVASHALGVHTEVVMLDAAKFVEKAAGEHRAGLREPFDMVYADPPYYAGKPYKLADAIGSLMHHMAGAGGLFAENSLLFMELGAACIPVRPGEIGSVLRKKKIAHKRRENGSQERYQHQFDQPWRGLYRALGIPLELPLYDWRSTGTTVVLILGARAGLPTREVI